MKKLATIILFLLIANNSFSQLKGLALIDSLKTKFSLSVEDTGSGSQSRN
jgi:hypothetical protein